MGWLLLAAQGYIYRISDFGIINESYNKAPGFLANRPMDSFI